MRVVIMTTMETIRRGRTRVREIRSELRTPFFSKYHHFDFLPHFLFLPPPLFCSPFPSFFCF